MTDRQPVDITKQRATTCGWCSLKPTWALRSAGVPTAAFVCTNHKKALSGVFNNSAWSWKKLEAV